MPLGVEHSVEVKKYYWAIHQFFFLAARAGFEPAAQCILVRPTSDGKPRLILLSIIDTAGYHYAVRCTVYLCDVLKMLMNSLIINSLQDNGALFRQ